MQTFDLKNYLESAPKHIGALMGFERTKVLQLQLRAGSFIPEHDTDADVLILVQKGKAVFDFSGKQIELDPQSLLYMLPAEKHSVRALDEDVEMVVIRIERA
ncbi:MULTISPECIES: AraC family ligand binding domain-containing protein [Brevibacillus]|jgi:quercetin dioxygenase-like cupin family protein|uniref:AraC-type arabinose-binding/dimerisation domain-containing protein n=1 Tax=Brevibacillus parabrevis TaxID=54914 RepID=A0A4Y3PDH7_BREPA|nr:MULTISPECIES: AraC family ligand binding domain-containing protein [Brevibacillus]TGV08819.1 hypothetical protein EN829_051595 [Mesorhizobium sp. M00.F.Ca.ET.186.01.1.1]MDH6348345.1 quercetin dioxygenase-like cupin family protein [Brevibacillus sp. 1238]MED1722025.1 AraC family ligand binding domain-containing protein [Brevibacillus parabrevis]MED2256558.1 AraC family ligand binding domain-containing protein [Brevibacillus parabrevis]NRQ52857.1 AraC family ligand binding domain-containing p